MFLLKHSNQSEPGISVRYTEKNAFERYTNIYSANLTYTLYVYDIYIYISTLFVQFVILMIRHAISYDTLYISTM